MLKEQIIDGLSQCMAEICDADPAKDAHNWRNEADALMLQIAGTDIVFPEGFVSLLDYW